MRQTGIPDQHDPGLNVRVHVHHDQAVKLLPGQHLPLGGVLVPDAPGVLELENVEVYRRSS
ncbi:hypothetical protein ACVB8X_25110 [Streptomyces sp. NRAIS4]